MKRKALSSSSSSSKIGLRQWDASQVQRSDWRFLLSWRLEKAWSKKHQSLTILKKETHNIGVLPKRWLKCWIYSRTPQPYSNRNHRQDPVHLGSFYDTHFRTSEAIQPQTFNLLFQSVASCSSPKTAHFKYQHLQHLHLDSNTSPSYSSQSAVN